MLCEFIFSRVCGLDQLMELRSLRLCKRAFKHVACVDSGQRWSGAALTRSHYMSDDRERMLRILKPREKSLLYGVSPDRRADVHRDRNVADGCCVAGLLDSGAAGYEG